jgi:hypothetical protein
VEDEVAVLAAQLVRIAAVGADDEDGRAELVLRVREAASVRRPDR